jgi:hypothetical protein
LQINTIVTTRVFIDFPAAGFPAGWGLLPCGKN